jgi:hypothetical protein
LQQIAAEPDALAMSGREEQPHRVEFVREDAGHLARSDAGGHPLSVDLTMVETTDVEQHAAVAQVTGRPAVSAGPDADTVTVGAGVTDRRHDIGLLACLHDHVRKALRQNVVPHGVTPR